MLQRCSRRRRMIDRVRSWIVVSALSMCAFAAAGQRGAGQMGAAQGPQLGTAAAQRASVASLSPAQQAEFAHAQRAAAKILAGAEFQRPEPTLWDRVKARIVAAIIRIFLGIDRVTTQSPWVGRALEWMLFLAAAVGLLVWVMRTVQRQRLRVAMGGEPAQSAAWVRETEDWRRKAEQDAAKGAWRDAIHALYWAAVVHLEGRRAWRPNPSRTPREYVRLLKAGSAEQRELRGLTSALEQSWYGQREANAEEFGAARESFERLADAGGEV
ncbi:MAG TPA: DUF4129 domain-containing protein [Acidobacteriaceae bacterium]|nr:DUF4129 domain-containing protein [Acidobacteriaceae bacterium]